ncbi:acyl carrier protein [Scytonema sp. PRP1]|uniref:acyl carrier protein n=1 Tax=Scytonema sp. PRP1 TaxID=3120513 RepID=UPI002FD6E9D5
MGIQLEKLKKLKVFEKVRSIVAEKLEIEPEKVTPVANFATDLGADSLDMVELVMALEEAFKIEISNQVIEPLLTIQQIINYISQKVDFAL